MFWAIVCTLNKGKVLDRDILGPFEIMSDAVDAVEESEQEIVENEMRPCSSIFELLSDDVPELIE